MNCSPIINWIKELSWTKYIGDFAWLGRQLGRGAGQAGLRAGRQHLDRRQRRQAGSRQLTHSRQDRGPALSPDGKWVAYYSGSGGRDRLRPDLPDSQPAGGLVPAVSPPARFKAGSIPTFSPDGKGLLFVGLSDLKVIKAKGSELSFMPPCP